MREPVESREGPVNNVPAPNQPAHDPVDLDARRSLTTSDMAGTGGREGTMTGDTRSMADREHQESEGHKPNEQEAPTPLFNPDEAKALQSHWDSVQAAFVDDPRHAVEDADHLVAEAIQQLARVFADERSDLERQWDRNGDVSTEELRLSLQKYRSFFQRVLAA